MQQIPRSNIEIKPMFRATPASEFVIDIVDILELEPYDEINTLEGWKKSKDITLNDIIIDEENNKYSVSNIIYKWDKLNIHLGGIINNA